MTDRQDLAREMARFEAARVAAPVELAPAAVRGVLAVLDGTDQDPTVRALASALAARTGAEVRELEVIAGAAGDPLEVILAAAEDVDVVVVPSPFQRDFSSEHRESLSTTVDLLLCRCKAALCLARGPVADAAQCVAHPLVALQLDRHRKMPATALALALAKGGGGLALLSIVDPQERVAREELLGRDLDPKDLSIDVLQSLASARAAALTSTLQRHAKEWDVRAQVTFQVGDVVERTLELAATRRGVLGGGLIVGGRDRDATSNAAQNARRLILRSELPVLLV
jgi:hypothetical protein